MSDIPSGADINVHDSLDEQDAVRNFLGKNREEALAVFTKNFPHYSEDLMWMGPRAFCYYVEAAMAYMKGADDDVDLLCFVGAVAFQVEHHRQEVDLAFPRLARFLRSVLADLERFGGREALAKGLYKKMAALLASIDDK